MKKILPVIGCACLTACAMYTTLPVSGKFEKTNERFIGTATGNSLGEGSLKITIDSGVTCQSKFKSAIAISPTDGVSSNGEVDCSDGRTGKFTYAGTAHEGNGFGSLSDGQKFIFTYGIVPNVNTQSF